MDSRQAKEILDLYRPGVDDDDPQFAEALAQAQRDPELGRWLEEQRALYAAIRSKMKNIPVPLDLRDRILGERKLVRPVVWWRSQFAMGAAAVLVICLSIYFIVAQLRSPAYRVTYFPAFRDQMVYFVAARYKYDIRSDSFDVLRQQFVRNGWPSDYVVPPHIAELGVEGGCLMRWREHKVSMLCLRAPNHRGVWLCIIERAALPDGPKQSVPQIAVTDGLPTASWTENGKTYLLIAEGDEPFLRTLL